MGAHELVGLLEENRALRGEPHGGAVALKQAYAVVALKLRDVLAERRLGDVQLLGCIVVVEFACQRGELVVILDMNSDAPSFLYMSCRL